MFILIISEFGYHAGAAFPGTRFWFESQFGFFLSFQIRSVTQEKQVLSRD
jgi:hypothetical protein